MKKTIDINCDLGEGTGIEEQIAPFISSASIACGYHAGNADLIRQTIAVCIRHQVSIGAHPSFDDRNNFGRTEINLSAKEIYHLVQAQILILDTAAKSAGTRLRHVKPHGALYNMAARDPAISSAIAHAIADIDPTLILYGLSGSQLIAQGIEAGLSVANEVFADRTYMDDGSLTPRNLPGALITDKQKAVIQVLQMIRQGSVRSVQQKEIPVNADTICIHGDGTNALSIAMAIHARLGAEEIDITPL